MIDKIENSLGKVLVCDGSYMIHRSLHVQSLFELETTVTHERTGGIFGFLRTFYSELRKNPSYFPIVCFDQGQAPRRLEADPNYKNHQERVLEEQKVLTPEEAHDDYVTQYRAQRNKLIELLSMFGVPCLKFVDWEGDDLMYILSKMSSESLVLTDDRDMLQLLSDKCKVRRPMADELWDLGKFLESRGFDDIYDFVMYKAIMGDGSDNIPGSCKGIGDKSVNELIKLLKVFDGDFSGYPLDETSMREFCKSYDIKYKKAYLNFIPSRYQTNLELVDLNKVEVPEDIYESIKATIANCRSKVNYFGSVKMLNDMEIREFSPDELIQNVSVRYNNLMGK